MNTLLPGKPILKWVADRIKKNKNAIIVINGPTGSGKSFAALSLAIQISEDLKTSFTIKDNMDFKFPELLKKMSLPQNNNPGTVFLFEEVGAFGGGASSREWQSQANKFFWSFMQTSRHKNQIFIMTCPHFNDLELGARKLIHLQMETRGIDSVKKIAYLSPYRIQVNSRTGKFYFKFLRIKINGVKIKMKQYAATLPPPEIIKDYEIMKNSFTAALNKEILAKSEPKKERPTRPSRITLWRWKKQLKEELIEKGQLKEAQL